MSLNGSEDEDSLLGVRSPRSRVVRAVATIWRDDLDEEEEGEEPGLEPQPAGEEQPASEPSTPDRDRQPVPEPPEPLRFVDFWVFQMTEEEEERLRMKGLLPRGRRWEPLDEDLDEHKMAHAVYEAWMEKEYRVYDSNRYYGRICVGHTYTDRTEPVIEFESFSGRLYYFRYVGSEEYPNRREFRRAQDEEPEDEGDEPEQVQLRPRERFRTFAEAEAEEEGGYDPSLWDPEDIRRRRQAMVEQEAQGVNLNNFTLADRRMIMQVLQLGPGPIDEDEDSAGASGSGQGSGPRATKAVACQGGAWVNADRDQPMVLVDSGANEVIRPMPSHYRRGRCTRTTVKTASGDEVAAYRNRGGELMLPSASGVEPDPERLLPVSKLIRAGGSFSWSPEGVTLTYPDEQHGQVEVHAE